MAASALAAKDDRHLLLMQQARTAFERVQKTPVPDLASASECVQAQAASLSVALPAEVPPLHFQKGYCLLNTAAITRDPAGFTAAAEELDKGGDPLLAWLSRIQAGPFTEPPTVDLRNSSTGAQFPDELRDEHLWVGHARWLQGNLEAAARSFQGLDDTGWPAWIGGLQQERVFRYSEAIAPFRQALDAWSRARKESAPSLWTRLAPHTDVTAVLTELGGAQLVSGDIPGSIATLDSAVRSGGAPARAYYLRARARELAGQVDGSLSDYNLASRTAFADAEDLASGEAHLYRGILLYRRKDFGHAEDEFSAALNLAIPAALQPDAAAWRHLSAVASGSCAAAREQLDHSLATVSPFFPKAEAMSMMAACTSTNGRL